MPTMADRTVPDDIERKDLTGEQVAFLKKTFAQQTPHEGLEASFTETPQDNGLTTLLIHFSRPHVEPAAAPGVAAAYDQNKGLDLNGDGKVTKAEAASKVAPC